MGQVCGSGAKKDGEKTVESPQKNVEKKPVAVSKQEPVVSDIEKREPEAAQKQLDPFFDLIMNEMLAKNEFPTETYKEIMAADHQPMCVKHCNEELFNKLKDKKSSGKAEWTMARTINSGIQNPTSFVGCHVGDMESYDDFQEFWYPLIEEYHKGFIVNEPKREEISTAERFDINKLPKLNDAAKARIVSTRIRCARNLADFPLNPGAPNVDSRQQILELLESVYSEFPEEFKGKLHKHEVMSEEEREGLVKAHFLFRGKDVMQAASGYHQFWPKGRGIFVREDQKFLNWINEGDHIRIISMEKSSDVEAVFQRLGEGARLVEDGIRAATNKTADEPVFMFHPKLGSVTCCPSNLGSGLRAGVFLQIPNLLADKGFEAIDEMCRAEYHCQIRGTGGEHSSPGAGGEVDVSNWRRIGFWEYELVTDMVTCVNALAEMEAALSGGEEVPEDVPAVEEAVVVEEPAAIIATEEVIDEFEEPEDEVEAAPVEAETKESDLGEIND